MVNAAHSDRVVFLLIFMLFFFFSIAVPAITSDIVVVEILD